MTSTEDRPPTTGERYIAAAGKTDADVILAAAFAQAGNVRGSMALTLYRVAEDWHGQIATVDRKREADEVARMLGEMARSWRLADRWLAEIVEANAVAARAGLSPRGREVFDDIIEKMRAVAAGRRETVMAEALREAFPPADPPRTLPHELVALHDWAVPQLRQWSTRGRAKPMTRVQASQISERVLRWWCSDVCGACQGRGYQLLPGTQIRSDALCTECNGIDASGREFQGMGRPPVDRRLKKSQREAGRWLASEFGSMLAMVLSEMAARLRPSLDVNLDRWPEITGRLEDLRSAVAQED